MPVNQPDSPAGKRCHWLLWALLVVMLAAGLHQRVQRTAHLSTGYQTGLFEARLAAFLQRRTGLSPELLNFTEDRGIQGLRFSLPDCRGPLDIIVMPEGDELLALWQQHVREAGFESRFLFARQLYRHYPGVTFWLMTGRAALAYRLGLVDTTNPGPVIALAYPAHCNGSRLVPWADFSPLSPISPIPNKESP